MYIQSVVSRALGQGTAEAIKEHRGQVLSFFSLLPPSAILLTWLIHWRFPFLMVYCFQKGKIDKPLHYSTLLSKKSCKAEFEFDLKELKNIVVRGYSLNFGRGKKVLKECFCSRGKNLWYFLPPLKIKM